MAVHLDSIETLTSDEQDGVLKALTRVAVVSGLTATDYSVLDAALDTAGVPVALSALSGTNLVLVRRQARLQAAGVVYVTLEYLPKTWDASGWTWSGGASLTQEQISDYGGSPLTVEYTYPVGYVPPELEGVTKSTGVNVSVTQPDYELRASGEVTLSTAEPWLTMAAWIGRINSATWKNINAGCAQITDCRFETVDYAAKIFKFDWTFQIKSGGWQPVYKYIDPNTGFPPPDLVSGVGVKTLTYYPTAAFATLWP